MSLLEFRRDGNISYPGLVRPYTQDDGNRNIAVRGDADSADTRGNEPAERSKTTRMNDKGKQICDPYSVYDDDHEVDFYYVFPQGDNLCINEWNRTVRNTKSLRNIVNKSNRKESVQDRTCTFPPYGRTRTTDSMKAFHDQGEYCYISSKSKTNIDGASPSSKSISSRLQRPISSEKDVESLREFAHKFAVSETSQARSHSTAHSFHDRKKINTCIQLNGIDGSDLQNPKHSRTKIDDTIDLCTCMLCVKGIFYAIDTDDDLIQNPCTCTGNKLKGAGRWLCLGLFSLFLPCLCCYLPARGCLRFCRTCQHRRSKKELLADHRHSIKVKYTKEHCPKQKETIL